MHPLSSRRGFTLIELLVVIAIIAVLAVVVVLTLNPAELLKQSRDANRVSDKDTLTQALSLYQADQGGGSGYTMGNATTVYVSLPDPTISGEQTSTCSYWGLPALISGFQYQCSPSQDYRNVNGTGWLPINLASMSSGLPLSSLPVDPMNTSSSGLYYAYTTNGSQFEITNNFESMEFKTQYSLNSTSPSYPDVNMSSISSYDQIVLADYPTAFWNIDPENINEIDLSGNGNTGTYENGLPATTTMPNGDMAADFNGSSQYLTIQSNRSFSIPTTGNLTWEAWIRPDTLQFPHGSDSDYVDFMGKCATYDPSCEWEGRMYDTTTEETGRGNRISAYVFNPSAGLGSAADWQPVSGLFEADQWIYVVGEYTTQTQPSDCPNTSAYPGSINIWVDGVEWNQSGHNTTGCMSQYNVVPQAGNSALDIGTVAMDTWFEGAIGKVAIYNYLLSQSQIDNHYQTMTGQAPAGNCGSTCSL